MDTAQTRRANKGWAALCSALLAGLMLMPAAAEAKTKPHRTPHAVERVQAAGRNDARKTETRKTETRRSAVPGLCRDLVRHAEKRHGIPAGLLESIMVRESTGRPWVLNYHGKDHIFDRKEDAVKKAEALLAEGKTIWDYGCMQRNQFFHKDRTGASLADLMEPAVNVEWAASYLAALYRGGTDGVGGEKVKATWSWRRATAMYHSWVPERGETYVRLIEAHWAKIRVERGIHIAGDPWAGKAQTAETPAPAAEVTQADGPLPGRQPLEAGDVVDLVLEVASAVGG